VAASFSHGHTYWYSYRTGINRTAQRSVPPQIVIPSNAIGPSTPIDQYHIKKNEDRRKHRRGRWLSFVPASGRIDGGRDYVRSQLKDRIALLADHIAGVKRGEGRHIIGLAEDIRASIQMGSPMGLLQTCAAADDMPLIIFTMFDQNVPPPPGDPNDLMMALTLGIKPLLNGLWNYPIDIDEWLSREAFCSGATVLTHNSLISEIGNTIGAHVDRAIIPSVLILRASEIETFDVKVDFVGIYLMQVAEAVISLAQVILAEP
jgi:hypothetical protein